MERSQRTLVVLVVCLSPLAGCAGGSLFPAPPDYRVYGTVVANLPANAIVLSTEAPRIRTVAPIQTVVQKTAPEDSTSLTINKTQYQRLQQIFNTTDTTTSNRHPLPAIYVHADVGIVRISITKSRPR